MASLFEKELKDNFQLQRKDENFSLPLKENVCAERKYKSELVEHQKSNHSEHLDHQCKMCERKFKTSKRLEIHMKIHQDSKIIIICEICHKE